MFLLNRLFSGRSLKNLVLISCFMLIAATIWWLGPFLGFGPTRPLQPVVPRIVFIILAFIWLCRIWWCIPSFLMVALSGSVLVWEIGPFFLIGNSYPLASQLNRLICVVAIAAITLCYAMWKLLLALSVNPHLLQNLKRFYKARPEDHIDNSEVAAVVRNAAAWTRKVHASESVWRRFFLFNTNHVELPWYLVLGNEKAGKTSLIAGSGQHFPLPEQLSRVGARAVPTTHCECWFANDALFIDTAGKYVSDGKTSQTQWHALLNAIARYRAVKTLNGVIVAISATDILSGSKAEQLELAVALRSRLGEIRSRLGVFFPVYVVLTKLDRLGGFDEYFRNLTVEGREQILGVTFPYGDKNQTNETRLKEDIARELQLLEARLENNMNLRQQEEYAVADRKKMYALPQDFRLLSQGVTEVVKNIFFASRYDETQFYTSLRGIYFASSYQPGETALQNPTTLIQRWRKFISTQGSVPQEFDTIEETESLISHVAGGRQYFLRQLFAEVIVKDAGLVRDNQHMTLRHRLVNIAGHCVVVVLSVWLLNGLFTSYQNNTRYLDVVSQNLHKLELSTTSYIESTDDNLLPGLLRMSQTLQDYGRLDVASPDLRYRYGLYAGKEVARQADSLYQFFLHKLLLPKVEIQAAKTLQDAIVSQDNDRIYEALKLTLMLSEEGRFDPKYATTAITEQWLQAGKAQLYGEPAVLATHLTNLFSQPDWWRDGIPADPQLIKLARAMLARGSVTVRLYGRLKNSLQTDAPEAMTLNQLTGSDAPQIFTLADRQLLESGIPGLFTYAGYHKVVKKKGIPRLSAIWDEDRWVMGYSAGNTTDVVKINEDVLALYLQDYRQSWERFIASIRLVSIPSSSSAVPDFSGDIYMLRTLASGSLPLLNLARALVRETTLTAPDSLVSDNLPLVKTPHALNNVKKLSSALILDENKLLAAGVDNAFSPLRTFVNGSDATNSGSAGSQTMPGTQLNKVMGGLMDQYTLLVISSSAINQSDVTTISDSGKMMAAEAQSWPDPFKNIIQPLLSGMYEKVDRQTIASSQKSIDAGPAQVCRTTLGGRYPFADSEQDVSLSDIEHFFAKGGVADEYFQQKLADKVDTSVSPWRYKGGADSQELEMFEQAAVIRQALFQDNEGRKLALHLTMSVPYMSPTITQLVLHVEGNDFKYTHGPVTPVSIIWPGMHSGINLSAMPRLTAVRTETMENTSKNPIRIDGAWSFFHWLDRAQQVEDGAANAQVYTFPLDTRRVDVAMTGLTYGEESVIDLLHRFKCPQML
ncbi:type VI secretion system membrane subunit TssM [Scandinavium goeteborgense]|uniref:type VI secretion system membrane subunit TssM n=1 Tax=Scandinavium goeteborgense TaxID=1851514 RepID=UPI003817E2A2